MFRLLFIGLLITRTVAAQFNGAAQVDSILSAASKGTGPFKLELIKDSNVVYKKSFGDLRTEKVNISATSKWLAAATLLTLVDDGLISLDEGIGKYLRHFKGDKEEITLRQLLSHTSGLPANSVYILDPDLNLSKSVNKTIRKSDLISAPGTQFVYGDVSYQIAGYLAEEITGKDWEALFKEKIAQPCGMSNTDFGKGKYINVGEGAYSTAEDFSNFLIMIMNNGVFNGTRVLSEKSIQNMLTDQVSEVEIGYTPYHFKSANLSDYYGLGVWINRVMSKDDSASEVSARGANGFTAWIKLCRNYGGVYSFNSDLNVVDSYIEQTRSIIDASFDNCPDMLPEERPFYKDELNEEDVTNVEVKLKEDAMVSLKLYDMLGNEIQVLINGKTRAGTYLVPIRTNYLTRGSYFYRLIINDEVETKKIRVR